MKLDHQQGLADYMKGYHKENSDAAIHAFNLDMTVDRLEKKHYSGSVQPS